MLPLRRTAPGHSDRSYAQFVFSRIVGLAAAIFFASACSPGVEIEPGAIPPTLVMWSDNAVTAVRADITVSLEVTGSISQVTPGPNGELAWTAITSDPARALVVFDGANGASVTAPFAPFFYHWSPEGDRLALLGNSPSGQGLAFATLTIDEEAIRSVEAPSPFFFDWSPDGTQLVAHLGGSSIGVIDAASGEIQDLGVEARSFPAPAWIDRGILVLSELGPSIGAREVPVGLQATAAQVVLIDPAADTTTALAEVDQPTRLFPGAQHLALVIGADGRQTIDIINWSGGLIETIGAGTIEVVQWSPDGSRLLWTERLSDNRLQPRIWNEDGTEDVDAFVPSPTFATSYIPFWDQYDRALSLWSHDSARVAFATTRDGASEIVVHGDGEPITYPGFEMAAWGRDDFESRVDPIESDS